MSASAIACRTSAAEESAAVPVAPIRPKKLRLEHKGEAQLMARFSSTIDFSPIGCCCMQHSTKMPARSDPFCAPAALTDSAVGMMDIYERIVALRREGRRAALATIIGVRGSIPSYRTAKMIVCEDGATEGTIGGGSVEAEVRQAALEVIAEERSRNATRA